MLFWLHLAQARNQIFNRMVLGLIKRIEKSRVVHGRLVHILGCFLALGGLVHVGLYLIESRLEHGSKLGNLDVHLDVLRIDKIGGQRAARLEKKTWRMMDKFLPRIHPPKKSVYLILHLLVLVELV